MISHAIDRGDAQDLLSELVGQAAQGEDVILTRAGEPVAKIIPIARAKAPRMFGSARGMIRMADDFDAPLDDFRDYM
ncbi:MAG TPA: type II toxin-antitoxin system prevent-host-death family antitoxin [Longimicrobium sp.]|nr:type II toxin-antitoxin system prevent-host-death family antitoxin [Longimicrobium sp.]